MVTFTHLTPCKWGEKGWQDQWSLFDSRFAGSLYNEGAYTLYEKMYDFSAGDRTEWSAEEGVTFGEKYAYIPAGKKISKTGMTFPESGDWQITLSIGGGAFRDTARIGLIDDRGSLLFKEFTEESINAGRVALAHIEYDDGEKRIYIYEGRNTRTPFIDANGKTITGIYIQCVKGDIVLKTVNFTFSRPLETKVMQHSNISITNFEAANPPQSLIITNKEIVSGFTKSYVPGIFPSESALVFNSATPGDYYGLQLESGDILNVSSRLRLQASSHFTIGFSTFMIEINGTETRVLDEDGNVLRNNILQLPSPTETLLINFIKHDEDINCRIDLENPQKLATDTPLWTGGLFNYPHRNPDGLYKVENIGSTNLYLDYILCGDQLWEPFM